MDFEKKSLEEWRLGKLWSQSRLEKESGLKKGAISRIEAGERTPRLDTVAKVCQALGVKPEQVTEFAPLVVPKDGLPNMLNGREAKVAVSARTLAAAF